MNLPGLLCQLGAPGVSCCCIRVPLCNSHFEENRIRLAIRLLRRVDDAFECRFFILGFLALLPFNK